MENVLKKPYEISVWEDRLVQDNDEYKLVEKKLAIIGSDTMSGMNKIYDPIFTKKANGERKLTFSLKYKYFDPFSENYIVENPFVPLLTNERKVKLHYEGEWYEFIVKDHTESSEEYEWHYECEDAFVLELSKNGYNIVFDTELNNNLNTAGELAIETLKDTDWVVEESDIFQQFISEPIYKASLVSTNEIEIINASQNEDEIPSAGSDIYLFYSYVKNQNGKNVQFIIRDENREYVINDKNVIIDTNFRITGELVFKNDHFENKNGDTIITFNDIETRYQADRLAYDQLFTYDPVMEKTVKRFGIINQESPEIYQYTNYIYTTSNVVTNYFTNGENFNILEDGSLQGWDPYVETSSNIGIQKLELVTKPEIKMEEILVDLSNLSQVEGFLKAYIPDGLTGNYENAIFNSGIENNASFIQSISIGEKFVFRWRAGKGDINLLTPATDLRLLVARYTRDTVIDGRHYRKITPSGIIMNFNTGTPKEQNNYIRGGFLRLNQDNTTYSYVIDDVIQTPSTKYIYIDESNNEKYVWNGLTGNFEIKTSQNYLPYYYLVATATQGLSNLVLGDVTEKIGIFLYSNSSGGTYFIEDIQLTRFVPDASDQTGVTPVLIGNVPLATSISTDFYYLAPDEDTIKEDIITYTSLNQLASSLNILEDNIVPLYDEASEKNLSISVSKSNCFDILQTISETFECWIDLKVLHDENGYILYDEDGRREKYVCLKKYAGKDNWAGFKYGINLKSIEREIDSTEFVTKLIVEQSQSDYVDEGYVSIASAPSNVSGESYILDFDYYYNQNLLNREEAEEDRLRFITDVAAINTQIREKSNLKIDLENSLMVLGSKRNTFIELIDSAKTDRINALGRFERLTNRSYEEYQSLQASPNTIKFLDGFYILTKDTEVKKEKLYYTYSSGMMTAVVSPSGSPQGLGYYEKLVNLSEEETIAKLIGTIYTTSAIINSYSGLLTNIEQEYWQVRERLRGSEAYDVTVLVGEDNLHQRHVFVSLNDYLPGFSFSFDGDGSTYYSTVSVKYFDITTDNRLIRFTAPEDYVMEVSTYNIIDDQVITFQIFPTGSKNGIDTEIEELIEEKDSLVKTFNNKYSRFIQEGTWTSTDYIDAELYYLDAVQVGNTSSQPKVSYTINVVEVSELEGYEWYLFDAGEKTYIEDTEFFGWNRKNIGTTEEPEYILQPAREEVIISEVEWHLEDPSSNTITVQNYKTQFEDFFQRVGATVQKVEYNEATYAKTSSILDANGTINQNVLANSLTNLGGKEYSLTSDGSVIVKGDVILIQNLLNQANRVVITSEGIRVSSNGGESYSTVIDGQGINISMVYTGTLNTNEVIIGNQENPSFRWDKAGISAFKLDENDTSAPYDLQTFVRFDQYGLYGIKNNSAFKAQSLSDILNKAHFAVTWDGFFIKNSYPGGGRVEITSDNDFRVMNIPIGHVNEQEKIKIGALEWGKDGNIPITSPDAEGATEAPTLYGIRIRNNVGATVLKTGDDGNLEITGTIYANAGQIGGMEVDDDKLSMDTIVLEPGVGIYTTVEDSNNNPLFSISDVDGSATFRYIEALGGLLGNLTVTDVITVGALGAIESANYSALDGWHIDNYSATFNNANVRGAITALEGNFLGIVNVGPTTNNQEHIIIDGTHALIRSSGYQDGAGAGWLINKKGDAYFNNITARGAIKTAVFEYSEVQSVSGVFLFRPSSTIRSATENGNDLVLTVEKPLLFSVGHWCKVSNYIADGEVTDPEITNIMEANGLTHVYRVSNITTTNGTTYITLDGAKALLTAIGQNAEALDAGVLVGGALINMGYKEGTYTQFVPSEGSNPSELGIYEYVAATQEYVLTEDTEIVDGKTYYKERYEGGVHNYGIGINSSDNTVNLPARAISLFETAINEQSEPKVTYKYKAILGTLPTLSVYDVDRSIYTQYMEGSQGVYTNNLYIGDADQYIAFYEDSSSNKHLKIKAQDIVYEVSGGREVTYADKIADIENSTPAAYFWWDSAGSHVASGDSLVELDRSDPSTYGFNALLTPNLLALRQKGINLAGLTTNALTFYIPPNGTTTQGPKALEIGTSGLTMYNPVAGNSNVELMTLLPGSITFKNTNGDVQATFGANGAIQSGNYARGTDTRFANSGMKIDLIYGEILTPNFRLSQGADSNVPAGAYIQGTIEALDGKIGGDSTNYWSIGNYSDYNQNNSAAIRSHGSAFIQLGSLNTWRLATNRIHSAWNDDSSGTAGLLHYPSYDNINYWDSGLHLPTSSTDKFLYIRKSNIQGTEEQKLTNLQNDIDDNSGFNYWTYKFYISADGSVYAKNLYILDDNGNAILIGGTDGAYLLKTGGTITGNLEVNGTLTKGNQSVGYFTATPVTDQIIVADGTTGGIKASGATIASITQSLTPASTSTAGIVRLTDTYDPTDNTLAVTGQALADAISQIDPGGGGGGGVSGDYVTLNTNQVLTATATKTYLGLQTYGSNGISFGTTSGSSVTSKANIKYDGSLDAIVFTFN